MLPDASDSPSEARMEADLTAKGGAEAGDPDLLVGRLSSCRLQVERATRVALGAWTGIHLFPYIASGLPVLSRDADDVLVDDGGELKEADGVGDGLRLHNPQHGADAVRLVTGLAPPAACVLLS